MMGGFIYPATVNGVLAAQSSGTGMVLSEWGFWAVLAIMALLGLAGMACGIADCDLKRRGQVP